MQREGIKVIRTKRIPYRRVYEGTVDVCCHQVSFWYDVTGERITESLEALEREAEDRAQACIIEGFHSGELCYLHNGATEITGWWKIERGSP